MTSQISKKHSDDPQLFIFREADGVKSLHYKCEPRIYTELVDTTDIDWIALCFEGFPESRCRHRSEKITSLCASRPFLYITSIQKISITSQEIIFHSTSGYMYFIPHTPETFCQCQQIVQEYGHLMKIDQ